MGKKKVGTGKRRAVKPKPPSAKPKPPSAEEMARAVRRRSGFTFDQLVGLAMSGDREALQKCADMAAVLVDKLDVGSDHADLKDWLIWALLDMKAGKSPDDAFARSASPDGRPPDFMTAVRQHQVVRSVEARVAEDPGIKLEAVFAEVANVYKISPGSVGRWYRQSRT